ncbi:PAS domain S-box-containing protein [Sphingomonas sp. UYAg733]
MKWLAYATDKPRIAGLNLQKGPGRAGLRMIWSGCFVCIVILALLTLALVRNTDAAQEQQERAQWWRAHTLNVLIDAEAIDTALNKTLRGERGYLLTTHPKSLAIFRQGLTDYYRHARRLHWLSRDNAGQQRRLAELDARVSAFRRVSADVVDLVRKGQTEAALNSARTGREREAVENASSVLDQIKAEERRLLSLREAAHNRAAVRIKNVGHIALALNTGLLLMIAGAIIILLRARVAAQRATIAVQDSEQQYRLLADNATDVVLRTNDDGFVVYASPSCFELSGYNPAELTGQHCGAFIHPADAETVHNAHVALVSGAESALTVAYRLRHKCGDWRWLESHMKPWRAQDGKPGGIISAIRDIGARKDLEAELVAARDKAEGAAQVKAMFLANMSHEIRTPMNGVLGFTELVLSGDLDTEQRRHVELIAESGRSMMRLLNDILDISKIDSGKMTVAEEPIDLRHIVRRCVDLMSPVAQAKGVAVSATIDPTIPPRIVGDSLRLRQVMLNLIGNAVKFTEHGAVAIDAKVEGDTLRIEVTDTGIGIPAERLGLIFDQFAQADDTTARVYGGTGLGLAISGELARLMRGSISVRSVVGKGSTFAVVLPFRKAENVAEAPGATASALAPDVLATRRPKVLIAEDHDINQELIIAMARRAGMDPELAIDGAEAVRMVTEAAQAGKPFELVLMDMQMPEVDGLEATRRLRASGFGAEKLPIIALTANAYAEDIQACLAVGMQAHLAKPVRVRDLTDMMAKFLIIDTCAPAIASVVSPSLLDRYRARKADTLHKLERLVEPNNHDNIAVAEAVDLLHKLAGTAAMFGEAALGELAKQLEDDLLAWPAGERVSRVPEAVAAFKRAA